MKDHPSLRFAKLGFDDFRKLASDDSLSVYEKIGFPDSYRKGKEASIFADIRAKLPALERRGSVTLDIGPGCSDVPRMLIALSQENSQALHLVDSDEMLAQLPDAPNVSKTAAFYPQCPELIERLTGKVDSIILYSVFHYLYVETNWWNIIDVTCSLLAPGGHLLLGDIPNISMRKRLFCSDAGKRQHREYTGRDEDPPVEHFDIGPDQIDDAVVLAILQRVRGRGLHGFVLPQPAELPMSNRREDILVVRP